MLARHGPCLARIRTIARRIRERERRVGGGRPYFTPLLTWRTPTATVGIRGTGLYVQIEDPQRTYVCTCYGTVELEALADPDRYRETVTTRHHDEPRWISAGGDAVMVKAPVINHTDDELRMLEQLVGRTPPFGPRQGY